MIKSVEELNQVREAARSMVWAREGHAATKIIVGMGDCGLAAGARDTLRAIMDELVKRKISEVAVLQNEITELCDKAPVVTVCKPNQPEVTYGLVTPERARQIVARHVVNDQVTGEWVVKVQ